MSASPSVTSWSSPNRTTADQAAVSLPSAGGECSCFSVMLARPHRQGSTLHLIDAGLELVDGRSQLEPASEEAVLMPVARLAVCTAPCCLDGQEADDASLLAAVAELRGDEERLSASLLASSDCEDSDVDGFGEGDLDC